MNEPPDKTLDLHPSGGGKELYLTNLGYDTAGLRMMLALHSGALWVTLREADSDKFVGRFAVPIPRRGT